MASPDQLRTAGGERVDEEVVVGGNLITSHNLEGLPAFCSANGHRRPRRQPVDRLIATAPSRP